MGQRFCVFLGKNLEKLNQNVNFWNFDDNSHAFVEFSPGQEFFFICPLLNALS